MNASLLCSPRGSMAQAKKLGNFLTANLTSSLTMGSASQRVQESNQLLFLLVAQIHLESLVIEIHQFVQICRRAIMEIRCTPRHAAQYRPFHPVDVSTLAGKQSLARIGGVERHCMPGILWVRAIGDEKYRCSRLAKFRQCGCNRRVLLLRC